MKYGYRMSDAAMPAALKVQPSARDRGFGTGERTPTSAEGIQITVQSQALAYIHSQGRESGEVIDGES